MAPGGMMGGASSAIGIVPTESPAVSERELQEDIEVEERRLKRQQARWAKEAASHQKSDGFVRRFADFTEMVAPRLMVVALFVASVVAAWRLLQH
ncbi:MAG: hypothetical protein AAGA58_10595 [Verrucomicrobiota bacterium]